MKKICYKETDKIDHFICFYQAPQVDNLLGVLKQPSRVTSPSFHGMSFFQNNFSIFVVNEAKPKIIPLVVQVYDDLGTKDIPVFNLIPLRETTER